MDSVWLGPPRATFPWRARYVAYGFGLLVMIIVMFIQRRLGIGLDFLSVAWALVITVAITRFVGARIDYERPLGQVLVMFWHEVTGPRRELKPRGGPVRSGHVRIGPPVAAVRRAAKRRATTARARQTRAGGRGRRAGATT